MTHPVVDTSGSVRATEGAMTDYLDKTYLLVAKREDEHYPLVIGAMPASTRGIIFEVIVTIPNAQLAELFDAHKITPSSIQVAP